MKCIVLCWLLLAPIVTLLGQDVTPNISLTKADYLKKSKDQRTVGWVLVGVGTTAAITGLILANSDEGEWFGPNFGAGATLLLVGVGFDLASIPFFISAASNSRKAAALSFKLVPVPNPGFRQVAGLRQPTLSLKIPLGK